MSQPATSSGSIAVTAGATVIPSAAGTSQLKSGTVHTVILTPAAAASTLQLYDGTSTAGTLICSITAAANTASTIVNMGESGCAYATGLYIVITGASAVGTVHYKAG